MIIQLTTVHKPFDTRIFHKECVSLAASGFNVVYLSRHPIKEIRDGVQMIPIPETTGKYKRVFSSSFKAIRAIKELNAPPENSIIHFHDPELLPAGFYFKKKGYSVIYDVHEDVPRQILTKDWIPSGFRGWLSERVESLEQMAATTFDAIVAAEPVTRDRFPAANTTMVQNFPINAEFANIDTADYCDRDPILTYIGDITEERGIFEMTELIEQLNKNSSVTLELGGMFASQKTKKRIEKREGWKHIKYYGWMDRKMVSDALSRSRIGLVILHKVPNHMESYPTKMLEYMAAGLPVIVSDIPLWRSIVERSNCGLVVDPTNIQEITEATLSLLNDPAKAKKMGENGQLQVTELYSWEKEFEKLKLLYRRLLK